jgi:hypothetical protein
MSRIGARLDMQQRRRAPPNHSRLRFGIGDSLSGNPDHVEDRKIRQETWKPGQTLPKLRNPIVIRLADRRRYKLKSFVSRQTEKPAWN